jgi:hypothetical protein
VAVLLVASGAVLLGVARIVDFPGDFNRAQSSSAPSLAERPDRWADWRDAANRDLVLFVPSYVVYGAAALAWAVPGRRARRFAVAAIVLMGAADVVETLLFRGTLERLTDGAAATDLTTRTDVTRLATGVKYTGFLLVLGALATVVTRRGEPR